MRGKKFAVAGDDSGCKTNRPFESTDRGRGPTRGRCPRKRQLLHSTEMRPGLLHGPPGGSAAKHFCSPPHWPGRRQPFVHCAAKSGKEKASSHIDRRLRRKKGPLSLSVVMMGYFGRIRGGVRSWRPVIRKVSHSRSPKSIAEYTHGPPYHGCDAAWGSGCGDRD